MSSVWNRLIFFCLMILAGAVLPAQNQNININPKSNSPYSRYGLGDFNPRFFAAAGGMAGLSAAYNDPYHLNVLNPASLAHLQATAFEVGMYAQNSTLMAPGQSDNIWSGNLSYLALGFPLINPINRALDRKASKFGLGMSFALMPYTQVGYDVRTTVMNEDFNVATNFLKGTGGSYRLQWGNAFRYKGLAGGINMAYQFGKITNNRRVTFDSLAFSYNTEFLDEISQSGLHWSGGLQYTYSFQQENKKGEKEPTGRRIVVGVFGNSDNTITTNSSQLYVRSNASLGANLIDTLIYEPEVKGKLTLPAEIGFGISFEERNDFRIGAEYRIGNWSKYSNEARPEKLMNNYRFVVGGEYIPDIASYNRYFERVAYRAGFFFGTDPRHVNGQQIKEVGMTLGFGFPIIMPRQQVSYFDVAIEAGRFGIDDLLQENYVKLTLGFTLNDNTWFFKRKFN